MSNLVKDRSLHFRSEKLAAVVSRLTAYRNTLYATQFKETDAISKVINTLEKVAKEEPEGASRPLERTFFFFEAWTEKTTVLYNALMDVCVWTRRTARPPPESCARRWRRAWPLS